MLANRHTSQEMQFIPLHDHIEYKRIKQCLNKIKMPQLKIYQLLQNLKYFEQLTQETNNGKYYDKKSKYSSYTALRQSYNDKQILQLFSQIAKFVLQFRQKYRNISILSSQSVIHQISFKKRQILYILCLMTLNLVPIQQYHKNHRISSKFNENKNFKIIFTQNKYKTKCIIEYLKDIFLKINKSELIDEQFVLRRQIVKDSIQEIVQKNKKIQMKGFDIKQDADSIENYVGTLKVDFANKQVGGGSLTSGCVQEEIMFANHPEMYVSILFCEVIKQNQAILFVGFKKYHQNKGYSYNTQFGGIQKNLSYKLDKNKRNNEYIVAIDAEQFQFRQNIQFKKQWIDRQIRKAYAGFLSVQNIEKQNQIKEVTTGNWGCGIFKGDLQLKFIIQWIACTLANKKMNYCPFGESKRLIKAKQFLKYSQLTVSQLYQALIKGCTEIQRKRKCSSINQNQSLFQVLQKCINHSLKSSSPKKQKRQFRQLSQFVSPEKHNNQKNHNLIKEQKFSKNIKQMRKYIIQKQNIIEELYNIQKKRESLSKIQQLDEKYRQGKKKVKQTQNEKMQIEYQSQKQEITLKLKGLREKLIYYREKNQILITKDIEEVSNYLTFSVN